MPKHNSTSFKPGQSGNPGGLTKEARAARDIMLREFDALEPTWRAAYERLLQDGNPQVVLDYTYRRLGKPVERSADVTDRADILEGVESADVLALARLKK